MKNWEVIEALRRLPPEGDCLVYNEAKNSNLPIESVEPAMVDKGDPPDAGIIYVKE